MAPPRLQEQTDHLRELFEAVQAAQTDLLEGIEDAHAAGMPLRVIALNVGVNHERIRRALAHDLKTIKPF